MSFLSNVFLNRLKIRAFIIIIVIKKQFLERASHFSPPTPSGTYLVVLTVSVCFVVNLSNADSLQHTWLKAQTDLRFNIHCYKAQ